MSDQKHVAHWDDVEPHRRDERHLAGAWSDLGTAAESSMVGVQRIQIDPGKWSTPAHQECAEEEIFYVLGGSGLSWQDGQVYEVGPDDCLVHNAWEEAHTLRAGPDGLEVLAFGMRAYATTTVLRRAGVSWLGDSWVESGAGGHPWEREAAAGEPEVGEPAERPGRIVNVVDAESDERDHGGCDFVQRNLGAVGGSLRTGLRYIEPRPGKLGWPPHCHSAEEELFVVLDGEGALLLGDEEIPVRRGHVVARPPGTGVPHAFRAGEGGLGYLAYGTREANDIAYYPRSGKIAFRGVGVIGRIEKLDYWDGEEA